MKKSFLLILIGLSVLPVEADEYTDPTTKIVYNYEPDSGIAQVKTGKEAKGEITILERFTINGQEYVVNSIGNDAFAQNNDITSVAFPQTVETIEDRAFYYCSSLTSVSFSEGLKCIEWHAFEGSGITSLELPEGLREINSNSFIRCNRLKSVWLPSTLERIGETPFASCDSLESIVIDEDNMYYSSYGGSNAIIRRRDESMPDVLVIGCGSTVIPSSVGAIADEAFWLCTSLKGEFVIPDSVESIGRQAFYKCNGLSHITLPKNLRSIGGAAFVQTSLEKVTIPSGVTDIQYKAFAEIPTLTSITSLIENPFPFQWAIIDRYNTVTLYVPAGTKEKYMAVEGWKNFTHIVEMEGTVIGDANGDGNLTVADMAAIAHYVLGHTLEGFSETVADANQDGQVNVADYTAVAHLLLYGSIERPAGSRESRLSNSSPSDIAELENTVYISPVTATAGEEAVLSVRMKNAVDAEGFQFTLTLPEGMSVVRDEEGFDEASLSTERTTKEGTNTFATSILPDGTLKVMGASTNGSVIKAGDGEVCTVRIKVDAGLAEGDYALLLSDVAISDTNAKSYDVEPLVATLTVHEASGISAALNDKGEMINEKCFDLHGRQLSNSKWLNSQMKKGVYIQDGRKYVK